MNSSLSQQNVRLLVRNPQELALLKKSGEITARALKMVIEASYPGVSLLQLEEIATREITRLGGQSSFKTVPGYYYTTCLTVNDEVVHGIPRPITLREGDVLGVDLGAVYKGWHTDSAWSVLVGGQEAGNGQEGEKRRFLKAGEEALWKAVAQAKAGNRIGDISSALQQTVERAGYRVVKSLSGHGVGRAAHEDPEVPTFGKEGVGLKLQENMTIAIESIYAGGRGEIYEKDDGWTLATDDGSLGGLFEMSVIVGKNGPEVLTDWRKY